MKIKDSLTTTRFIGAIAIVVLCSIGARATFAQSPFTYSGTITTCDPAICALVPIFVGDPVVGSITLPANPGEAFDLDVSPGTDLFGDFNFLVGGVIPVQYPAVDPMTMMLTGVYINGSGAIDGAGKPSGLLTGEFVGGTLGGLVGQVTIDLATGAMEVSIAAGTIPVASVVGAFAAPVAPAAGSSTAIPVMPLSGLVLTGLGLVFLARRRLGRLITR